MEPIQGLMPGSKLRIYHFDGYQVRDLFVELVDDGIFHPVNEKLYKESLHWEDLAGSPREAILQHIRLLEKQSHEIHSRIGRCQALLKQQYPVHPVLSLKRFADEYPNLHENLRLEDYSPEELRRMDDHEYWKQHQYDEPG